MRSNAFRLLLLISCVVILGGCAVKVQDDYSSYLTNNAGETVFPKVDGEYGYESSLPTQQHHTVIKSWMAGIANSWEVRFNDILVTTLNSQDVRNAIHLHPYVAADSNKIHFNLLRYDFSDGQASIQLQIQTTLADETTLSQVYTATGQGQLGKMFWGGALAMKNAVQQSSKDAMDKILKAYFQDLSDAVNEAGS